MTAPRLFLDEDIDPLLARILMARGHDVVTTQAADHVSATDIQQLIFATQAQRAILTHNVAHFSRLAREWASAGREHAGIILSEQLPLKELLARILRLLHQATADSLRNRVVWLQDYRR